MRRTDDSSSNSLSPKDDLFDLNCRNNNNIKKEIYESKMKHLTINENDNDITISRSHSLNDMNLNHNSHNTMNHNNHNNNNNSHLNPNAITMDDSNLMPPVPPQQRTRHQPNMSKVMKVLGDYSVSRKAHKRLGMLCTLQNCFFCEKIVCFCQIVFCFVFVFL